MQHLSLIISVKTSPSCQSQLSEQVLVIPAQAENERLHLLTFLQLKQPGPVFRFFVLLAQASSLLCVLGKQTQERIFRSP